MSEHEDHGMALSSWTFGVSEQIAILALALLAYEGSIAAGGNGFVATFAGGILSGRDQGSPGSRQ